MPPPKLTIKNNDKEASEEPHGASLDGQDPALHWAEQSTPLLGRRRRRNLSNDSDGSLDLHNAPRCTKRTKVSINGADSRIKSIFEQ
mmetsp:Transcript_26102/g.30489  ORF Transcript_26102/g.30489 Transcript_26102/m.30489 type:complete len:87 (+) Transcript_26102:269-529(+)